MLLGLTWDCLCSRPLLIIWFFPEMRIFVLKSGKILSLENNILSMSYFVFFKLFPVFRKNFAVCRVIVKQCRTRRLAYALLYNLVAVNNDFMN